ncbi:MAG TPA: endonuclease/exonuclease/phosphatase family protein, partial [Gemmatimonadaceae bacterium]|nr:endonuclease/exonuclease/phosphatase family protein [Gemmatimonadaceae bacterium]
VLAVGCAGGACAPRGAPAAAPPLRVLVYNIHAGMDAAQVPSLDRVAAVIRDAGADVVLLQEVDSVVQRTGRVDQVAVLGSLTGLHGVFGRSLDFQGGGYGIAVLSRWPIVAGSVVRLPVFPPQERAGGSHEPRSALWVEVAAPGAHLHVINTHLDPSGADSARLQEIGEVLRLAEDRRRAGDRVLLGGDLNSTPESETQHRVRDAGWQDAWAVCGGAGDGFSYPDGVPRKRIDYLYLGAGERCRGAQVIESHASDHRPLLVLLER